MVHEFTKDDIKSIDPSTLAAYGIVRPAGIVGGERSYECPHCGNGSGDSHTGIVPDNKVGVWRWHCLKCDKSFDNIHLLAEHYGLDETSDFPEICRRACDEFGINFTDNYSKNPPARKPVEKNFDDTAAKEKELSLIRSDITDAQNRLADFINIQPDKTFRRLTLETLSLFGCGFNPAWTHSKLRAQVAVGKLDEKKLPYPSRRVIIPYSADAYTAVLLDSDRNADNRQYWKQFAGRRAGNIFGKQTLTADTDLILVVEGEIDAMSIHQATGGKFPVIATGSASNSAWLPKLDEIFSPTAAKKPRVLILFDNDDAGRLNAPKIAASLIQRGYPAAVKFLSADDVKRDANDILRDSGETALADKIQNLVDESTPDFDAAAQDAQKKSNEPDNQNEPPDAPDDTPKFTRDALQDCPINLQVPYNFVFEKFGISFTTDKGTEVKVSFSPVVVTNRLADIARGVIRYEISFREYGGHWKKILVDASTLADSRKILSLADDGLSIADPKGLTKYFNALIFGGDNPARIPTINLFENGGWHADKFIYPVEGNGYIVSGFNFDYRGAFSAAGEEKDWVDVCARLVKSSPVAALTIGASLAAPLIKPLGLRNLWLHLAASSGRGKTALAKFAMSIYGNPEKLQFKFHGTGNSLETIAVISNGFPSFVDELQTANKLKREEMDDAIYNFESGRIKSRNTRNNELREPKYFSGVRITTGEQTLTSVNSGEGAIRRTLEITLPDILDDALAKQVHAFVRRNYGLVGRKWTEYLAEFKDSIAGAFAENSKILHDKYQHAFTDHIDAVAAFQTALQYFVYLFNYRKGYKGLDWYFDTDAIFNSLPVKGCSSNAARAIDVVAEFVATHPRYFLEECAAGIVPPDKPAQENYGCILEGGDVGIFPDVLREKVLCNFPNADAVINGFHESGYLIEGNSPKNKFKKSKKLQGRAFWLYVFRRDALFADAENNLDPADD